MTVNVREIDSVTVLDNIGLVVGNSHDNDSEELNLKKYFVRMLGRLFLE